MEKLNITCYSLYELCTQLQEAVQNGYVISTDNEDYPQMLGVGLSVLNVVKESEKETEQVEEVKLKGRPKKV